MRAEIGGPLPLPDQLDGRAALPARLPSPVVHHGFQLKVTRLALRIGKVPQRAAALLAGQPAESKPATKGGEYLILIGAFSNEANVKNLKAKLGEQGIKSITNTCK